MDRDYTKIDPDDIDAVIWVQLALTRLLPSPIVPMHVGDLRNPLTMKVIRGYQGLHKLQVTSVIDEATLQKIRQELKERDLKP